MAQESRGIGEQESAYPRLEGGGEFTAHGGRH